MLLVLCKCWHWVETAQLGASCAYSQLSDTSGALYSDHGTIVDALGCFSTKPVIRNAIQVVLAGEVNEDIVGVHKLRDMHAAISRVRNSHDGVRGETDREEELMDVVKWHLSHIKEQEPAGGIRWLARYVRCHYGSARRELETWVEVQQLVAASLRRECLLQSKCVQVNLRAGDKIHV